MPDLKTYKIFISHAWTYNEEYYRLVEMLKKANNFSFANYSVPEHDPLGTRTDEGLYKALEDQIRPTHIVIVIAGMYALYRKWIEKEIEIAKKFGKPIIGIRPYGMRKLATELHRFTQKNTILFFLLPWLFLFL